jgi:hypothetical protein
MAHGYAFMVHFPECKIPDSYKRFPDAMMAHENSSERILAHFGQMLREKAASDFLVT